MKEQYRNISEAKYYKDNIAKEQERLRDFLIEYLPTDFKPEKIMDFCCSAANEEPLLYELYGQDISITSFDNSQHILQLVRNIGIERKSIIKLDLEEIDSHFQNAKFDLIIGRNIPINPNYNLFCSEKCPDSWGKYINNIKNHLSDNGFLLMTFAREDEFYRGKEILNDLNFRTIIQEKNKIAIPSDYIGIAGADIKDNYVVLATK